MYGPLSVHFVCHEPPAQQQFQSGIWPSSRLTPHFAQVGAAAPARKEQEQYGAHHALRRAVMLCVWGCPPCVCFSSRCGRGAIRSRGARARCVRCVHRTICGALRLSRSNSAEHNLPLVSLCALAPPIFADELSPAALVAHSARCTACSVPVLDHKRDSAHRLSLGAAESPESSIGCY